MVVLVTRSQDTLMFVLDKAAYITFFVPDARKVVNEVFLDLLRLRRVATKDRVHFLAFAPQLKRRVLDRKARGRVDTHSAGFANVATV